MVAIPPVHRNELRALYTKNSPPLPHHNYYFNLTFWREFSKAQWVQCLINQSIH